MAAISKAVVTVIGFDRKGIIAHVSGVLYEHGINILDISQTILDGYFTMLMVVDLDGAKMDFDHINSALQPVRDEMKMMIHIQRMDLFDAMHRI